MKRADEDDFHAYVSQRLERWRRTAYLLCQDWHTADERAVLILRFHLDYSLSERARKRPERRTLRPFPYAD